MARIFRDICAEGAKVWILHNYNYDKTHMSLDFKNAETPEEAFYRKLPEEMVFKYEGWLIEVYHERTK